jgi:Squalene-hopene cyclase C-terminal domain
VHIVRRTLMGASAVGLATLLSAATMTSFATPAGAVAPALPQTAAAQGAARWIGSQLAPQGTIDDVTPGIPDLSATVQAVIGLGATGIDLTGARAGLSYLKANAATYITKQGSDGPGQLANLILAAHVLGANPSNFGGTNLVARLLATEQTSGPNAGRFGTDAQDVAFNAGTVDQGLALAALAAVGVKADTASLTWLEDQQCTDGGWTDPDNVNTPCDPDPILSAFPNEDTNTTSYAIQGLAAQGALSAPVSTKALSFLTGAQDSDGGWPFSPNTAANPETSDPNSTALVIQALVALGQSPSSPTFDQGANTPLTALLSFQVTSGPDAGAFSFPGIGTAATGNVLATNQVIPALAGLTLPYPPSSVGGKSYWVFSASGAVYPFGNATPHGSAATLALHAPIVGSAATSDGGGYWLVASDGGVFNYGDAGFFGSRGGQPLNKPIVGMAATPDGGGYWLVASDGGIFSYGDAGFFGSRGGQPLNKPIVGMAATPDGGGYWLVASDGGIFSYGDASFYGSRGGQPLNEPVVGMASDPNGAGYWLVASDGGIFNYGDAAFFGSTGSIVLNRPVVGISSTPDGNGYWLVASDGGIFNFGDAAFSGSAASNGISNGVALGTSPT